MSKLQTVERNGRQYAVPYFPVGCIFISTSNENPSTHFGGTWVSFGAGKVLVGVDVNDTDFNTVEKTGGEKTHTLLESEMPSHYHRNPLGIPDNRDFSGGSNQLVVADSNDGSGNSSYPTDTRGGNQAHNNLQPYITVYMWKKTAN